MRFANSQPLAGAAPATGTWLYQAEAHASGTQRTLPWDNCSVAGSAKQQGSRPEHTAAGSLGTSHL